MAILVEFRKKWVPLVRLAAASIADVIADWYYYDAINKSENEDLEKYELYLFVFFIVAATMGVLTLISILVKGFSPKSSQSRIVQGINKTLTLEIVLEDIPQFVLSSLITIELGLLTPTAAFNIATSGFNFLINVMEMCEPKEEAVEPSSFAANTVPSGDAEPSASGPSLAVTGIENTEA